MQEKEKLAICVVANQKRTSVLCCLPLENRRKRKKHESIKRSRARWISKYRNIHRTREKGSRDANVVFRREARQTMQYNANRDAVGAGIWAHNGLASYCAPLVQCWGERTMAACPEKQPAARHGTGLGPGALGPGRGPPGAPNAAWRTMRFSQQLKAKGKSVKRAKTAHHEGSAANNARRDQFVSASSSGQWPLPWLPWFFRRPGADRNENERKPPRKPKKTQEIK